MTDSSAPVTSLTDVGLRRLHEQLRAKEPTDAATVQAHHTVSTEMLKRGIHPGIVDDEWASTAILVESTEVTGPHDIQAPAGFEKAWSESLRNGGILSVWLTQEGYVMKAEPTVSDVHVDTVMPGTRRRIMQPAKIAKTIKEEDGQFTVYSADGSRKFGTYSTRAAAEERLRQIERFKKEDSFRIPREVQVAAKQALEWIRDGFAGGGFTSVGRARAQQLADGGTVSRETLVKMRAYFARHEVDKKAKGWGNKSRPTPGMVAWYAWGGDAGRAWASRELGAVEKAALPSAVTDLDENVINRQRAIDEYMYGPLNPDEPGDYWERLGDVWGVSAEEASSTRCGNCAAFNVSPMMQRGIADSIGERGRGVAEAASLGYCEVLDFKCAASRSCIVWLTGGPITTDVRKHQQGKHDQKSHGNWATGVAVEVSQSILRRVREQGGLSVSMVDGSEPPDGFMVARTSGVKPDIVSADDFFDVERGRAALGRFLKSNKKQLTGGDYLGVWHDTDSGRVFLDVSQNVKDRATAERLGRERDQISIWDVVEGKEIPTGGTGEIAKADSDHRVAGFVEDDGRGDRRLRGGPLRQDNEFVKHQQGKHDQSSHGNWADGGEYKGYALGVPDNPPGETDKRRADSIAAARSVRDRYGAAEPALTREMIDVAASNGAKMHGLEFRLKSEKSLARKIDDERDDPKNGGDPVKTAESMSDVVRYTMVLKDSSYTAGAERIIEDLKSRGYEMRVKNYWQPGDPYQGINIAAIEPKSGVRAEVQIHTPTSLDFKEPRLSADDPMRRQATHALYETYRESKDMKTRVSTYRSMMRQAAQIPVPAGVLAIGTPAFQPLIDLTGEIVSLG